MGKALVGIGVWLLSDSIISIFLYLGKAGYNGECQTWRRDHWVRIVRAGCAIAVITIGVLL